MVKYKNFISRSTAMAATNAIYMARVATYSTYLGVSNISPSHVTLGAVMIVIFFAESQFEKRGKTNRRAFTNVEVKPKTP